MKFETIEAAADLRDLLQCLHLTPMPVAERAATQGALRELKRQMFAGRCDPTVAELAGFFVEPDPAAVAALGSAWSRIRQALGRALRAWEHADRRALVRRGRVTAMTMEDALVAIDLMLEGDAAHRMRQSVLRFCRAQGAEPRDVPATLSALQPLLAAATPETFGVRTTKARDNHVGAVRRAVRLVGGAAPRCATRDVEALAPEWREALDCVLALAPGHAFSERAILRRLAVFAAREGASPRSIPEDVASQFRAVELAAHADNYAERIRRALGWWNRLAAEGVVAPVAPPVAARIRVETVAWESLPQSLRNEFAALVAGAGVGAEAPNGGDWGALVVDEDDLALGLDQMSPEPEAGDPLKGGTIRNWKDFVKRGWQAGQALSPQPTRLADLLTPAVFRGVVRLIREKRRERMEAKGETFDPRAKGRREHSVLEGLVSIARRLALPDERIAELVALRDAVDPAILQIVKKLDGSKKKIFAARRIGDRHARKLRAFNDLSALGRWFTAPETLWRLALAPIRNGGPIRDRHVALARSAIMARVGRQVAPIRRTSLCRLRIGGDDPHIWLPAGDGEGRLHIPAAETKTGVELTVVIDAETVQWIRLYKERFLPVARRLAGAAAGNPHLFPGACLEAPERGDYPSGHGFITKDKANNTFRKHLLRHCAIDLNLHVMRHLAGKIILDQDPSAMALVQVLLGHKRISTTESYYAEVSQIVAQRRYQHLLDQGTRRVLASIQFRVGADVNVFERGGGGVRGS